MKTCRKCGIEKPSAEYYRHPCMADGRLNFCKACVCQRVRQHRRDNDSVREYDRARSQTDKRKQHLRNNVIFWKDKNPIKARAHMAVRTAVRNGELVRQPCETCGTMENIHAHHEDYSKPLDVIWFCALCHARHHARTGT